MGTLYIDEETGLRVVGVDHGEVLPEPEHQEVLARIVLVNLVGSECRHHFEENFTDELHEKEGMHQVLHREDEDESERNPR